MTKTHKTPRGEAVNETDGPDILPTELVEYWTRTFIQNNLVHQVVPLNQFLSDIEQTILRLSIILSGGNQKRAAKLVGVKYTTFHEKMKKLSLKLCEGEIDNGLSRILKGNLRHFEGARAD